MANINMINPCLWSDGQAVEAGEFYGSVFQASKIDLDHEWIW